MHIDAVPNRTSRPTYLLRESHREGKKVRTIVGLVNHDDISKVIEGLLQ